MLLRAARICILVVACAGNLTAKEPRQIHESGGAFVGSLGCKSSSCHGGAGPKRSQFTTWTQQDFHARAYAVLINSRSARIAETLGIAEAQASARCTVCHSPFQAVPRARRLSTAHPDEGVSCESCHGAAESWLRGHTRTDWNYNTRVGAGMHDLRSLFVRANTCVACHQNLEPELLSAGHPELFFELDGQAMAEPKHWRDDDPWNGPRSLLTGQAAALREMSWQLAREPQPNESSLARWNGAAWLCAKITHASGLTTPLEEPAATASAANFSQVETDANTLARRAATSNWSDSSVRTLLIALVSTDAEFPQNGNAKIMGQRAKRLVLAIDRLTQALNRNHDAPIKIEAEMKLLFEDVRVLDVFDTARFAGHLQGLRVALTQPSR